MKGTQPGIAGILVALWLLVGSPVGSGFARDGQGMGRIVSLAPAVTEMLYAIGGQRRLVGVSRQCDVPVAAKLKPKAGEFNQPDLDALRKLRPEVVLFSEAIRDQDRSDLDAAGIPWRILEARTLEDIAANVVELGRLTEREAAAATVAAELREAVVTVGRRVAALDPGERPTVYLEIDGPSHLYAVGPGSFMDDLIRVAGGNNALGSAAAPYVPVSLRQIVGIDPDVILIDHPFQYKVGVSKRPGWASLRAVRNHRVFDGTDFDMILLNRPGPRIAEALQEICRLLHPELWP